MTFKCWILSTVFFAFISTAVHAEEKVGNSEWKVRMQALQADVLILFPYAFNKEKFEDPKNAATIEKSILSMAKHSEGLKKHTARFKASEGLKIDPSFPFIAQAFENEISSAHVAFLAGPAAHPQSLIYLRSALSKCMICHTQSANGPELKLDPFKNQWADLSPTDRFTAMVATRQFEAALNEFTQILKDFKLKKVDQYTMDREAKMALSITVRVKKDPKRALTLVAELLDSGAGSTVLQNDIKTWKKSILEWQSETLAGLDSDTALLAKASQLIEAGKKREYSLTTYENSDVSLLRASSYLHELLSNYPQSPLRAQSYLLLADIYQILPEFTLWDLGDEYLGACIVENPHSAMGEACFEKYNESIIFGYSGSSGIHIPRAVSQQVEKMKKLATRLPETKKKKGL